MGLQEMGDEQVRFNPTHKSNEFTIWDDLDGKTMEQVIAFFQTFPKDAVFDARERWIGSSTLTEDYFVITWNEETK